MWILPLVTALASIIFVYGREKRAVEHTSPAHESLEANQRQAEYNNGDTSEISDLPVKQSQLDQERRSESQIVGDVLESGSPTENGRAAEVREIDQSTDVVADNTKSDDSRTGRTAIRGRQSRTNRVKSEPSTDENRNETPDEQSPRLDSQGNFKRSQTFQFDPNDVFATSRSAIAVLDEILRFEKEFDRLRNEGDRGLARRTIDAEAGRLIETEFKTPIGKSVVWRVKVRQVNWERKGSVHAKNLDKIITGAELCYLPRSDNVNLSLEIPQYPPADPVDHFKSGHLVTSVHLSKSDASTLRAGDWIEIKARIVNFRPELEAVNTKKGKRPTQAAIFIELGDVKTRRLPQNEWPDEKRFVFDPKDFHVTSNSFLETWNSRAESKTHPSPDGPASQEIQDAALHNSVEWEFEVADFVVSGEPAALTAIKLKPAERTVITIATHKSSAGLFGGLTTGSHNPYLILVGQHISKARASKLQPGDRILLQGRISSASNDRGQLKIDLVDVKAK